MGYDDRSGRDHRRGGSERWQDDEGPGWRGDDSFSGFGNQTPHRMGIGFRGEGQVWQDDRALERNRDRSRDDRWGEERGAGTFNPGSTAGGGYAGPGYDPEFGGPRFDRADVGSTGTHGAHPVASAFGAASQGYGGARGMSGSSARARAIMDQDRRTGGSGGAQHMRDPHYSEWRRRQIEQLDRDYEDYCRENQSRFEQEFGSWREERSRQRSTLGQVREHMEVIGSDGSHVGTVDKTAHDRIVLTKSDADAGGVHHSIPCSWIERVDEHVHLNRTAEQAMKEWRFEQESGAMFGRERGEGEGTGPHYLERAFRGTY